LIFQLKKIIAVKVKTNLKNVFLGRAAGQAGEVDVAADRGQIPEGLHRQAERAAD